MRPYPISMPNQIVQINLRIRSLTVHRLNEPPTRVDNSELRFTKRIELPAIPKSGDVLAMTAGTDNVTFQCTVTGSHWDDREGMFIISCSYTTNPMSEAHYRAVSDGSDWASKPLL